MATLQMRNYGPLGGTGGQSATADAATWASCVADAASGDTIHISYQAGAQIIKPPTGTTNRKSGVDFAIDEAVELWPQQGTGETFTGNGLNNVEWGIGNLNGLGVGTGPLGRAGKWGIQLNRRKNTAARGDSVVTRFVNCDSLAFRYMWVESMCETRADGKVTDYGASNPCFAYNAPNGQASAPSNVTLDHVAALNCTYGYGLCQIAAAINPVFLAISGEGGTVLRPEQQSGTWMRIENLQADGVYAYGGNCGFQANPHPEHIGALGMTFTVVNMTVENQQRAYLFDTINGLDVGSIDGLAVLSGTSCQIPVSNLPDGSNANTTTDGRTSQAWVRGSTRWLADVSRGAIENAQMQVRNVIYFGSFPQGGIPSGGDVTQASSAANLRASARWLAGFETTPPPPSTPFTGTAGSTPSGVLTKSFVAAPTSTPLPALGGIAPAGGVATVSKIFAPAPQPTWVQTPLPSDPQASAFFQAKNTVPGGFIWKLDGVIVQSTPNTLIDQISVPATTGAHTMTVDFTDASGHPALQLPYSWTRIQVTPPPVPVESPLPAPDTQILSCGYHTAYLTPRGGRQRLGVLHHTSLKYDNTESQTGTATVTIGEISRFGDECCQLVGLVEEWVHEVEIRRNGPVAFIGPITSVKTSGDSAEITASDMSAWFGKRRVHQLHIWKQVDLTLIARDVILDAFGSDTSPRITVVIDAPSGILVDYEIPTANVQLLSDVLRVLVGLGLVWRMTGRTMHLGLPVPARIPTFTEHAFTDDPDIVSNGQDDTNDVVLTGNNQGDETTLILGTARDETDQSMRGALESVQDKPDLSNPSDALHVAEALVDEGTTPSRIIEGGKLARTAPAVFQELAPLLKLDLLIAGCRPLRGRYRISKRSVTESGTGDEVSITIEPLSVPASTGTETTPTAVVTA